MSDILKGLNKPQQQAVKHIDGPLLILAGAGSGKTKTLTHRIAYIVNEKKAGPYNILAVTFTNKAAGEMKKRIFEMMNTGEDVENIDRFLLSPMDGNFSLYLCKNTKKGF